MLCNDFQYQAVNWQRPRRMVAKVERHPRKLFPRQGFIVTNLRAKPQDVVQFYNGRGTVEQYMKEGKYALHWFNFPFHSTGYAVACSYGRLVWAPFLLVWIAKTLLLRYGGAKLYLRALPAFLGFALGHFITAGLIWGSLAAAVGGPFLQWGVWFG